MANALKWYAEKFSETGKLHSPALALLGAGGRVNQPQAIITTCGALLVLQNQPVLSQNSQWGSIARHLQAKPCGQKFGE